MIAVASSLSLHARSLNYNHPLCLGFQLDMCRDNDLVFLEIVGVRGEKDGDNVQQNDSHSIARELKGQLCEVAAALAVDDEAEHHPKRRYSTEDPGVACKAFWVIRQARNDVLDRDLIDGEDLQF